MVQSFQNSGAAVGTALPFNRKRQCFLPGLRKRGMRRMSEQMHEIYGKSVEKEERGAA